MISRIVACGLRREGFVEDQTAAVAEFRGGQFKPTMKGISPDNKSPILAHNIRTDQEGIIDQTP
jgi:hypothetical protein